MFKRMILPLIFGLAGAAVLTYLGVWQLQRLEWKESVLSEITSRIGATPVAIPADPDPETDRYLAVTATGEFLEPDIQVLVSSRDTGAAYRLISAFETEDGRRVLVDRGLVRVGDTPNKVDGATARVTGNLHWPDERDRFTPENDLSERLWYARDVPLMAQELGTEPILIVASKVEGIDMVAMPLPVTTDNIPNNHLGYAIQWFGMAMVWLGMTAFLLWRIRRQSTEETS